METSPITILDGGMGQELVRRCDSAPTGLWSTKIMMDQPDLVKEIHDDYFAAGAQVATVNSYAVHRDRLRPFDIEDKFVELHQLACELANRSRDAHGSGLVAGSLGPLGWSYSHDGAPPVEQAADLYAEICRIQADFVDVFLIETIASVEQAKAAVTGAHGHGKPVWLALTVSDEEGVKLRSGETLDAALEALADHPPQALLLNCSIPEAVTRGLCGLSKCGLVVGGYANGFTGISADFMAKSSVVTKLSKRTDLSPEAYADHVDDWVDLGATLVGGCCEVGPDHIKELARRYH